VGLDFQFGVAERRIRPDVDGGRPDGIVHESPAGVNANRRQQCIDGVEIGGGESELRAAAGAVNDHPANAIGFDEQLPRLVDVPFGDQSPHARAGDDLAPFDQRLDHVQRHAGPSGQLPQHVDRAGPATAEKEIRSFDHGSRIERVADNPAEKVGGRELQERLVRRISDHQVHAQRGQ